jgi:hypothetical protein
MGRSATVWKSVLEAIRNGEWDYEPPEVECSEFEAADAMPGTKEKLRVLAERLANGLPLWHEQDRDDIEAPSPLQRAR